MSKGFTLFELLCSIALMSIMLHLFMILYGQISQAMQVKSSSVDALLTFHRGFRFLYADILKCSGNMAYWHKLLPNSCGYTKDTERYEWSFDRSRLIRKLYHFDPVTKEWEYAAAHVVFQCHEFFFEYVYDDEYLYAIRYTIKITPTEQISGSLGLRYEFTQCY